MALYSQHLVSGSRTILGAPGKSGLYNETLSQAEDEKEEKKG